jgi:hypothetical protein
VNTSRSASDKGTPSSTLLAKARMSESSYSFNGGGVLSQVARSPSDVGPRFESSDFCGNA